MIRRRPRLSVSALSLVCLVWVPAGCGGEGKGDTDGEPPVVRGVADLHLHMFAEEAFGGGGWLYGHAIGEEGTALMACDGGASGDHGRLRDDLIPLLGTCPDLSVEELATMAPIVGSIVLGGGELISEFVAIIPGTDGDTGEHMDRTNGYPDYASWPRWDSIAHQQSWEGHLKAAYDAGLRLQVISTVSYDWMCRAQPDGHVTRPQCDEMDDVRVQLEMANAFAEANDWAEVALTPADARRIVEDERLALVLSIEADHIMGDDPWEPQLDELYDLGVRSFQLVHQVDNRFSGAAPHNEIFQVGMYAENCHIDYDCGLTTADFTLGFDVDSKCKNTLGLTDEGQDIAREMMDRGMLIDAAHMSEQATRDLYDLSVEYDYYPFYISHGHFREIMLQERRREEKTTPAWVAGMLREVGGMFGLRTAPDEVNTYEPSAVENTCHGSSRSFAQAYDYGRLGLGVPMGLGGDFNGFIQQTRPRFGRDACSASFAEEATCQARDERASGPPQLGTRFDDMGLGHTGLLIDLLDDLDQLGTDTEPLRTSANTFIRMWERTLETRSGPKQSAEVDTDGITILPRHGHRLSEYPTECDIPYCAGGVVSGEECRFDAECESGVCAGAGDCGSPTGICD